MSSDPLDQFEEGLSSCCSAKITLGSICSKCREHCDVEEKEETPTFTIKCKWCGGSGRESVDGGSLCYACPDCGGTGRQTIEGYDPTDNDDQD